MAVETTCTALRERLAGFLDKVTGDRGVVIVRRRHARDVAILPADELSSLMETVYLLRSPKNAERFLDPLREVNSGGGTLMTVAELRRPVDPDEGASLDKASRSHFHEQASRSR